MSGSLLHWNWKASLISNLSVKLEKIPFQTMDELIASPYQITLLKDSSWEGNFRNSLDGPFKRAWETKFANKELSLQSNIKAMIQEVMTNDYVLYSYLPSIRTLE